MRGKFRPYRSFKKEGGEGYLPIYAQKAFTNVHEDSFVLSMREIEGFCICNKLNSSLFARLQGGLYVMMDGKWVFVCRTLGDLTFKELKAKLEEAQIKDTIKQ